MTLEDGTDLSPALGIGAFIEKTLVHSWQCTKVDLGLLGCGGVGSAAVAGAALAGAGPIIAVDLDERKLEWARGLGATHTVNSKERDAVETIQEHTGGFGADVVIEAVGRPETWKQAFYARDLAGTVVLVGVPTPDMRIPDIPLIDAFVTGSASVWATSRRRSRRCTTATCCARW